MRANRFERRMEKSKSLRGIGCQKCGYSCGVDDNHLWSAYSKCLVIEYLDELSVVACQSDKCKQAL